MNTTRRAVIALLTSVAALLGLTTAVASPAGAAHPAAGQATRYTMTAFTNSSESNMYVYDSPDATGFTLRKGPAYTPPSGLIRDPSIFKHTDGYYYLTYTTRTWSALSTTIGFARSTDRLNWTFLYDYTVPISGLQRAWAPEWFVDTNGSVNIILSASVAADGEYIFKPYKLTATNSALTAWSAPTVLSGIGPNYIDTFIVKIGSTYHAFTKNETTKYIEYATASSLTGPYTIRRTGNWAGFGSGMEGPALVQLDNGGWRIYYDAYGAGQYWYSDSYDAFATWSTPTQLPGLTGFVRHLTVLKETVSGGVTLPTNTTRSLQSVNYPGRYAVARSDNLGYVDPVTSSSTTAVKQSATFTVVPGLADANCYSFRTSTGRYLRHWDYRIRSDADDGTTVFDKDATYCARPGTASGSVRLESYNYPGRYIRHYNYELRLDTYEATDTFRADSSFTAVTPWA
ncbi:glycoside hydrolase family 43 protein [Streptomyces scabiei]|uniref:glycoside hydrolase family 43 protein n=1 Tax=Streptomyces scabiei TaxID=1930 RepID=UPI00299051EE|nr:glycoside hydrolase family 43 protein [Streptomyces scabiei]MDW8808793.1 glycoside hydrolase family 43 protein [Streptomyces scabiei]